MVTAIEDETAAAAAAAAAEATTPAAGEAEVNGSDAMMDMGVANNKRDLDEPTPVTKDTETVEYIVVDTTEKPDEEVNVALGLTVFYVKSIFRFHYLATLFIVRVHCVCINQTLLERTADFVQDHLIVVVEFLF